MNIVKMTDDDLKLARMLADFLDANLEADQGMRASMLDFVTEVTSPPITMHKRICRFLIAKCLADVVDASDKDVKAAFQ